MVFLLKSCSLLQKKWCFYIPSSASMLTVVTIIRQFFYFSYRTIFFLQCYDVQLYWATTTYTRVALVVIVMLLPLLLLFLLPIIRIIYTSHKHSNLPFKSINKWSFPITMYLCFLVNHLKAFNSWEYKSSPFSHQKCG